VDAHTFTKEILSIRQKAEGIVSWDGINVLVLELMQQGTTVISEV
jgi:hypothetical protein